MSRLTVNPGFVAVVRRDGTTVAVHPAGRYRLVRPFWRRQVQLVDIRERLLQVSGQEIPTTDLPAVKVNAAVRWMISDPTKWLEVASDPTDLLRLAVQIGVRDWVGARTLEQVTAQRSSADPELREVVAAQATQWGITVLGVGIRDVVLPGELRKALAATMIARLEGQTALERARAETASLRALANAGKLLADHPELARLRLAQTASEGGGSVVIKLPG